MDAQRFFSNVDLSKLLPYSVGIVITDVDIDSYDTIPNTEIEVYPIEKIQLVSGDITKPIIPNTYPDIKNFKPFNPLEPIQKETIVEKVERRFTIKATWINMHQYNRITAPVVRRGEYVMLYRFANEDKFYWDTLQVDITKRKEEIVVYTYSVKPQPDDNENLNNMYYTKIDTKNKYIHKHTTDMYGEYTTYDEHLDTGNGYYKFVDGKNNFNKLDSTTDTWYINSNMRTWISVGGVDRADGNSDKKADTQYDIDINGKDSYITMYDHKNNMLKVDSAQDTWFLSGNKKLHIAVGGINPTMGGSQQGATQYDIIIDGNGGTLTITDSNGNNVKLDSNSGDITINTTNTVNINGGSTVNITSGVINIKGGQVNIN